MNEARIGEVAEQLPDVSHEALRLDELVKKYKKDRHSLLKNIALAAFDSSYKLFEGIPL